MSVLVVAALHEEVRHLPDGVDVLVTGVGKARAAAGLARRLAGSTRPSLVVNVGTAGSLHPTHAGVVEVSYVTEHDFPHVAIEALLGRPVAAGYVLRPDAPPAPATVAPPGAVSLATGDSFVSDHAAASRIGSGGAHLVDMEAFGYAAVCAAFAVPLRCVKAVSDSADEDAGGSWLSMVDACAVALADWVVTHVT
jgi:adenosylhomocysteine nucleosidase